MSDPPAWYLPVGTAFNEARGTLILDTFRPEIVWDDRALRAKVEAEHPGAEIWTKLPA